MKKLFCLIVVCIALLTCVSCADGKHLVINGESTYVEPYGWMNKDALKHDSVVYKVNTGNLIWSIVGVETIILPIYLTGTAFYEPVRTVGK